MQIKFPVGTTAENNQLNLPAGYLTLDVERKAIRLFDGETQGGFEVLAVKAIREPLLELIDIDIKTSGFLYDIINVAINDGADLIIE